MMRTCLGAVRAATLLGGCSRLPLPAAPSPAAEAPLPVPQLAPLAHWVDFGTYPYRRMP